MAEQRGLECLVYTSNGTTWDLVGGQRGGRFNMNTDIIDASHKSTANYFRAHVPGFKTWGIDLDVVLTDDGSQGFDPGLNNMVNAYLNNEQLKVYFLLPDDIDERYWSGFAVLGDFGIDAPHEDVATASGSLTGNAGFSRGTSEPAAA